MSRTTLDQVSPESLAKQLENDLYQRSLRPGQRYLSTREVQRRYEVSLAVATQAMQLLVEQELLVRRDRSGTFVGPRLGSEAEPRVKLVYVLMPEERAIHSLVPLDLLIESLRTGDKGVSVQVGFLPAGDEALPYLREMLAPAQSARQLTGVVPISCSRDVYRHLSQLGVPVVVLGSLDPDQEHLGSVDVDYFQAGRLLAEYLLQRGHKRLAVLGPSEGRPGDHEFHDGIVEAMTAAQCPPNALMTRVCPHDFELLRAHAEAVLRGKDRPTGIICRDERMMETTVSVMEALGLAVPADAEVVFEAFATRRLSRSPYPHVRTKLPFEQIAAQISEALHRLREGAPLESQRVSVPVELHVPGAGRTLSPPRHLPDLSGNAPSP